MIPLLVGLYLSQGLPFGFFTQALPVLMRQQGVDLGTIGLSNLLALPWALKFLWAPAIDRLPGPRRRVILPLQGATMLVLGALAFGAGLPLGVLAAAVFATNTLAATQDIATDALAVELLPPHRRGLANTIQVAGYRLGMVLGGGVMLIVFDRVGQLGTFGAAVAVLAVATVPLLLHTEPPRVVHPGQTPEPGAALLHVWAARPGAGAWLLVLLVYKLGDAFGTGMVKPFLVDRGYGLADVGWMLGVVGSTMGLLGAAVGGVAVTRLGRRRALLLFSALQIGTMGLYGVASVADPRWAWAALTTEHCISGMATVSLFTAMMDVCRPGHAGTDYTVQASVVVIAQGLGAALSGYFADRLGWPAFFGLSALLCAGAVWGVARHRAPAPFAWAS